VDETFEDYRGFSFSMRMVSPGWWNGWAMLDRPSRTGDGATSRTGFFAEEVSEAHVRGLLQRQVDRWHGG
jgi:hypothetical protein